MFLTSRAERQILLVNVNELNNRVDHVAELLIKIGKKLVLGHIIVYLGTGPIKGSHTYNNQIHQGKPTKLTQ
jgi:hypothetical protein